MVEKNMQTAQDQLDMNGFYGVDYYVKSGSGTMYLSQTGQVNDVKFSFKYDHNRFGVVVSVGYPWSIGFSLVGYLFPIGVIVAIIGLTKKWE